MSGILLGIAKTLLMSLVTEAFLKSLVVNLLEEAAKKSDNDLDDRIVADVKKAWGIK